VTVHHAGGDPLPRHTPRSSWGVLIATLTKDQWWFIVATSLGQAVITLLAVFLGARWALSRENTSRHRA
jgi:hypothetical protein